MQTCHKTLRLVLLWNQVADAISAPRGPVFVGEGNLDYLCGGCGSPLSVGMREGDLAGLAFACGCGSSSRVPFFDVARDHCVPA